MDASVYPTSPRKKLKVQHPSIDHTMESAAETPSKPLADHTSAQVPSATPASSKEAECGITEFINPGRIGFNAILKKRYTDFLVNEILPSGEVVHLSSLNTPKKQITKSAAQSKREAPVLAEKPPAIPTEAPEPTQCSNEQTEKISPRKLAEPDVVKRQKHKVFVRQTDEGIEEIVDKDRNGAPPSDGAKEDQTSAAKENTASTEPAETQNEKSDKPISSPSKLSNPSNAGEWQAYAGNTIEKHGSFSLATEDRETLTTYFGSDTVDEIFALHDRIVNSPHRSSRAYGTVRSAAITDRAMRTSIHQDLRRIFQSRLESATDDAGAMLITAASAGSTWHGRTSNNSNQRKPPGRQPGWHELGGNYLHFTLYKENKDTMEAISWLARQLRVQPKSFQFAGTKDRRAITVQRVSAYHVHAERLADAGRTLRQAKVGNYKYQPHELRLGDLVGNEFVITLRDCQFGPDSTLTGATSAVEESVSGLRTKGFLNYYGLQRFGTFATSTDTVGVKMLQGDYSGAVNAILHFNPSLLATQADSTSYDRLAADDKARACALNSFKSTGMSHPALKDLPRKFSAEAAIIRYLSGRNQANDFQGALNSIPRNLRLMYVHAYQSLVWNVMASERWKKYGGNVVEGDLVLIHEHADKTINTSRPEEVDTDGEPVIYPSSDDCAMNADEPFVRARVLSEGEAESGDYTIFDIVLPTPGFDILYPENDLAFSYKDFMASDRGGGLDPYNMRRNWKDISLSGSYRKLMARPISDVSYEVKAYTEGDEQFVETDLDRLNKETKAAKSDLQNHAIVVDGKEEDPTTEEARVAHDKKPEKIAVILKLQLGSSQYATMALRELLGPGGLQSYKPDFSGGR